MSLNVQVISAKNLIAADKGGECGVVAMEGDNNR